MRPHDIDSIRAWAHGDLNDEALAALEEALGRDSELAALARAWRDVEGLTALADGGAQPASDLTAADLDTLLDQEQRTRFTPWIGAAAAFLVLCSVGSALVFFKVEPAVPVALHSIPASADPQPFSPDLDAQLAQIADYHPILNDQVAWLDSLETGLLLARVTGRPLLLWCIHPTCPFCKAMRESTLLDPSVHEVLTRLVPVQLNVMEDPRYANFGLPEGGFPMFEVVTPELADLHTFFNYQEPEDFIEQLRRGLDKRGDAVVLRWDDMGEIIGVLQEAREAERQNKLGAALAGYQSLRGLGGGGLLSELGAKGVERLAAQALDFLDQARRNHDPARVLAGAAMVFAGSDYATDFRALEQQASHTGSFPPIARGH